MGKFRKKPVVIEAFQWTGDETQKEDPVWICEAIERNDVRFSANNQMLLIDTLEGTMEAHPYDWIIKGIKGEIYPCKPDIFEATYEAV